MNADLADSTTLPDVTSNLPSTQKPRPKQAACVYKVKDITCELSSCSSWSKLKKFMLPGFTQVPGPRIYRQCLWYAPVPIPINKLPQGCIPFPSKVVQAIRCGTAFTFAMAHRDISGDQWSLIYQAVGQKYYILGTYPDGRGDELADLINLVLEPLNQPRHKDSPSVNDTVTLIRRGCNSIVHDHPEFHISHHFIQKGEVLYFNEMNVHAAMNMGSFNVSVLGLAIRKDFFPHWVAGLKTLSDEDFAGYAVFFEPYLPLITDQEIHQRYSSIPRPHNLRNIHYQ
jgi:hypothetical protein